MKKLFLFLFIFIQSCSYNGKDTVDFKIINKTDFSVKLIKITNGYNQVPINQKLKKEDKFDYHLKFPDSLPKVDGSYYIKYKIKNDTLEKYFGYFTNGYPLSNFYKISIFNDTIMVKEFMN